ncbi:uncharacterized protein LAESUDRAFT_738519 [Laetiporus sulphureus 93-53]|uniref:NYN domain-containing protein n=1 Tax=Laetiporus sulphureus 93-53 TaxID=1314785 RepID=A0A165CHG6_9APHY|nr:uncharacterized protein LAESUDRAFT_738519 [Laetiporus sulphureus 93-53]KZT02821.1 hypothetical protein LAESUDRAFT_738519 [Laetiporus sulphureus 93-53]
MTQSVSDSTLSPTPLSPFSSYSVASGVTSDDAPDLGAFTTVFRALNVLQPRTGPINVRHGTPVAPSLAFSPSLSDSEAPVSSTVWPSHPISSYLSYSSPDSVSRGRSLPPSESDSTASEADKYESLELEADFSSSIDQPSLGYLDEALDFIAAERARFVAQRDRTLRENVSPATTTTTSDSVWRHVIQPRRKRRKKKGRSVHDVSRVRVPDRDLDLTGAIAGDATAGEDADADEPYEYSSSSIQSSSPRVLMRDGRSRMRNLYKAYLQHPGVEDNKPRLHHSKSTPNLIPSVSIPLDARVLHLRNLAHKLRLLFPQDAVSLHRTMLAPGGVITASPDFVDTRGPEPCSRDILIHVFVDHSNILIGFLSYIRRHMSYLGRHRPKLLSHAALALILERGRPVTRRVMVASSPLYQPVSTAEQLGYEVRVFARVPDTGDGADRRHLYTHSRSHSYVNAERHSPGLTTGNGRGDGHIRNNSKRSSYVGNGTSTESDTGTGTGTGQGTPSRTRYREQGVDELLQLKLHQAIVDVDVVPPNATIVLATGDGNVGQFNEEGFLGCVRTALKKGWRVELYAWEGGLSRAWMREFGDSPWSEKFQIHMLDRFASDLLEVWVE